MPVRLDQVRALAQRPAPPRKGRWIAVLAVLLACGSAVALLLEVRSPNVSSLRFWGCVLFVPFVLWCALAFVRIAMFVSQQSVADGWDEAREQDLIQRIRSGRRSQQVLAVSMYTALREAGATVQSQLDALLDGQGALAARSTRAGEVGRHSQILDDHAESAECVLKTSLKQVLSDLAPALAKLPVERPVALLLSVESGLCDAALRQTWQEAWAASGIRQSVMPAEGKGLAAVDLWLDQRIGDEALLMVIAVQIAPAQVQGMAENAVGLLFGNWLTQNIVPPIACLHRPEQERQPEAEHLLYAIRQALEWVPLEGKSIEHIWQAGSDLQRDADIASVLPQVPMPLIQDRALCHLDPLLGHPGETSAWLAIAAAALAIQRGGSPQFIFSGERSAVAGLWCTVLTPASPLSRQEF